MADKIGKVSENMDKVAEVIHGMITRRGFLKGAGIGGLGVATFYLFGCGSTSSSSLDPPPQVAVANALGMVVADSTLCVGCRRCEAACVAYNQGKVQPSIANVKVSRNQQFGVNGVSVDGFQRGDGDFGNFRTVQDTCRQCPHPVSCQLVCPHGAIQVIPPVNARVVNTDLCVGCGLCTQACPWQMISLDGPANGTQTKANKCTLCNGNPECVQACPSGALTYMAWADRTKLVPQRYVVPATIQSAVASSCVQCH